MPEWKRNNSGAVWDYECRNWDVLCRTLEDLRQNGEDIATFRIRERRGEAEQSAIEHPKTRDLFLEKTETAHEAASREETADENRESVPADDAARLDEAGLHEAGTNRPPRAGATNAPVEARVDGDVRGDTTPTRRAERRDRSRASRTFWKAGDGADTWYEEQEHEPTSPFPPTVETRRDFRFGNGNEQRFPVGTTGVVFIRNVMLGVLGLAALAAVFVIVALVAGGKDPERPTPDDVESALDLGESDDVERAPSRDSNLPGGPGRVVDRLPDQIRDDRTPNEVEDSLNLGQSDRRRIQAGLRTGGFDAGPADGQFGERTRAAIRSWQAGRGEPTTGYLTRSQADVLIARDDDGRTATDLEKSAPVVGESRLTVRTEPMSVIELNGRDVGSTNSSGFLEVSPVRPGRHVIIAKKKGYAKAERRVDVAGGRAELVELALVALPGTLTVTANVAGAHLVVDDKRHGLPVTGLELSAGSYRVRVEAAGYVADEKEINIGAGEPTTLSVDLEPLPVAYFMRSLRSMFEAGKYQEVVDLASAIVEVLHPDAGAVHLLLGRARYELKQFDESIRPLYRALRLGEQVVLETKHRHGGGGFRLGFCSGELRLSTTEVAFHSWDDPDHGFAVTPDKISGLETHGVRGQAIQLNTRVQDRGTRRRSFDFVHRDAIRQRTDPDSPLFVSLTCPAPACDGSLGVQEALMAALSQPAM